MSAGEVKSQPQPPGGPNTSHISPAKFKLLQSHQGPRGSAGEQLIMEEMIERAIHSYDKLIQKQFHTLDEALYGECAEMSARLERLECAVLELKGEAEKASVALRVLADVNGRKEKQRPNTTGIKRRQPIKPTLNTGLTCPADEFSSNYNPAVIPTRTLPFTLPGPSRYANNPTRSVHATNRSKRSPHPATLDLYENTEIERQGNNTSNNDREEYLHGGELNEQFDRGTQLQEHLDFTNILHSNGTPGNVTDFEKEEPKSISEASTPTEMKESADVSRSLWTRLESLVINMNDTITSKMNVMETELSECKSLFGQVSNAADKISEASARLTTPATTGDQQFRSRDLNQDSTVKKRKPSKDITASSRSNAGGDPNMSVDQAMLTLMSSGQQTATGSARENEVTIAGFQTLFHSEVDPVLPASTSAATTATTVATATTTATTVATVATITVPADLPMSVEEIPVMSSAVEVHSLVSQVETEIQRLQEQRMASRKSIKSWISINGRDGGNAPKGEKQAAKVLVKDHMDKSQRKEKLEVVLMELKARLKTFEEIDNK